jgi:hypothetical protein
VGSAVRLVDAPRFFIVLLTCDSLKKRLFAGLTYSSIHTTNNRGGEAAVKFLNSKYS